MPDPIYYSPQNEEEAAVILRECSQAGRTVRIRGGGTKDWLGNPYKPTDAVISTQNLTALVDYQPEDLTITVGAGMPFARLQEILGEQGQFLPLDPPDLPGQTVGGILATNRSCPRRLLYGTARDLLIGCRFVLADGSIGHSGGRVVKNVAGYDLHKLFIGAMGTLGLLTEVTFKVVPKPQTVGVGLANYQALEPAIKATSACVHSNLMPSALEIVFEDYADAKDAFYAERYELYFSVEGTDIAVQQQLTELQKLCRALDQQARIDIIATGNGEMIWASLAKRSSGLILKANTTLTSLSNIIKSLEGILEKSGPIGTGRIQTHAGTGIIYLYSQYSQMDNKELATTITQLRQELAKDGGSLVIERGPDELKALVDVWGDMGDAGPMMAALKKKLDPQGLFNPGVMDVAG